MDPAVGAVVKQLRLLDYPPGELRGMVLRHLHAARAAASDSPLVDLDKAQLIADALLDMLDLPELDAEQRAWVRAACIYFAETNDGEDDFDSLSGFDDDADVTVFVAETIGRPELVEALR